MLPVVSKKGSSFYNVTIFLMETKLEKTHRKLASGHQHLELRALHVLRRRTRWGVIKAWVDPNFRHTS